MAFLQKSMAEDSVDRFTSCVGVLLLLLLSLIALLLPLSLSPAFQPDAGKPQLVPKQKQQEQKSSINFQYQTICLTPAQFGSSEIAYVNAFCSDALNAQLHGENKSISIHELDLDTPVDRFAGIPSLVESYSKLVERREGNANVSEPNPEPDPISEMQEVFAYQTPVFLFVVAILLKVASTLGSFLSGCQSCINIDQTLKLATSQSCRSQEDQRHFNNQIAQSLSSKRYATHAFLCTKILLCIVLVEGILLICSLELPKGAQMEKKDGGRQEGYVKSMKSGMGAIKIESSSDDRELQTSTVIEELGTNVVLCAFHIRHLKNVQIFNVQCVIRKGPIMPLAPEALPARPSGLAKRSLLLTYRALHTAAFALLVVLLFMNVLSTVSWLFKLYSSCCTSRLQVSGTVSMDGLLLLYLARENAGIPVASGLASALAGHSGQGE